MISLNCESWKATLLRVQLQNMELEAGKLTLSMTFEQVCVDFELFS